MSSQITHKTALCLIPPENVWEQIQSIRSVHDKAFARWMPHINFIYPFVTETQFSNIKIQLEPFINKLKPIEIEFDQNSIQYFKQKSNECTFHLRPKRNKDVVELYQIIKNVLNNYVGDSRPFEAHLTLGQTTTSRINDILIEMKSTWKPIKFFIDCVSMISRENDPNDLFSVKEQIFLIDQKEIFLVDQEEISTEQIQIKPSITSNKINLCIVPPNEFSSRLLHLFEDTSFNPIRPFRIILDEYEQNNINEFDLRSKIESIKKFTIQFSSRSICFNYSTSKLFLKPNDLDQLQKLNFNQNKDFDGNLILGQLDKTDLTEVGNRFTENWTFATHELEIDHVHLIDSNERFQATFQLKSQCFS